MAAFTFVLSLHPRLALGEGKHLGANNQILAITAVYIKGGRKKKARCVRIENLLTQANVRCGREPSIVAMFPELPREFV